MLELLNKKGVWAIGSLALASLSFWLGKEYSIQNTDIDANENQNDSGDQIVNTAQNVTGDVSNISTIGVDEDKVSDLVGEKIDKASEEQSKERIRVEVNRLIAEVMAQRTVAGFISEKPYYDKALKLDPNNEELKKHYQERRSLYINDNLVNAENMITHASCGLAANYLANVERVDPDNERLAELKAELEGYQLAERALQELKKYHNLPGQSAVYRMKRDEEERASIRNNVDKFYKLCRVALDNCSDESYNFNTIFVNVRGVRPITREQADIQKELLDEAKRRYREAVEREEEKVLNP